MIELTNIKMIVSAWALIVMCTIIVKVRRGNFNPIDWVGAGTGWTILLGCVIVLVYWLFAGLFMWLNWVVS